MAMHWLYSSVMLGYHQMMNDDDELITQMAVPKHHQSSSQRSMCEESCSGGPTEQCRSIKVDKQKWPCNRGQKL